MMKRIIYLWLICCGAWMVVACNSSGSDYALRHEDKEAKELFQGVWINDDESAPALLVKGDSVFFPDTTSLPMAFWIYKDSLYLQGYDIDRYQITRQAEHVFRFINQSGDEIKLVKSGDRRLLPLFNQERPYALNIFRTIDADTTAVCGSRRYDCRIHIEPTSDRIVATTFNNEGIEVDNMYLDNAARVTLAEGGKSLFSHEFRKQEFSKMVPREFLDKSILSSVQYDHADSSAVYFDAIIGIPDASSGFVVELKVTGDGKLTKKVK